ncbi:Flp pilus assembly protein CpaB [Streptomyces sp. AJS327]|uniref:Flp pilus assembly protein CpaB n=1 Tax=Streptomyces sp. AJS327 TaxID=2545265 RepID=UPI0015DF72D4|nr:Flp pilus assembly protein CpaB [Streptomyces sp. AJS327]MBA0051309.1 Flp pilus assembly protein CpaB [Streptomyces sp. AJS327]
MNSRQRRGVILLLVSVLVAIGAFVGVLSVVNDAESQVGNKVTAYELTSDVSPYKTLSEGDFDKVTLPKRWLPDTAVRDLDEVRGKVATNKLRKGSLLQSDMLADRPELEPGQQEIAIMIDAETGVAGKITPGATVNVYATFQAEGNGKPQSRVLVNNAKVIDVGRITALRPKDDEDGGDASGSQAVPITFALNTKNAQRIAYAESFASHVRLALVAPGSDTRIPSGERDYTLSDDKGN